MIEYLSKAASVWFLGFFPLAEIYIAVPAGLALGLGAVSAIGWAVFGNFVPVLLIHYGYDGLRRIAWMDRWLGRLSNETMRARMDRWGVWAVLIFTPWTGVWAMAAVAKALGMSGSRLLPAALISILVYSVIVVLIISAGGTVAS